MGQRVDTDPYEYGNDCPSCTPPTGSRWPSGETPAYVYASFWDIQYCGFSSYQPPNGQIFRLPQLSGYPCIWYKDTGVWRIEWVADLISPAASRLRLSDSSGWSFFTDMKPKCPPEYGRYVNDQTSCILSYAGAGGYGTIWWNETVLEVMSWFGVVPGSDSFYEFFHATFVYEVHKFVNRPDRINVLIKKS